MIDRERERDRVREEVGMAVRLQILGVDGLSFASTFARSSVLPSFGHR